MIKDIPHKDHDHDHTEAAAACSTTSPQAIALQIASSVTATATATAHQNNNNIDQSRSSSTTSPLTEIRTLVYGPDTNCNCHCNCSEKQESRFIKRKKKIEKIKAEEQKAREYAMETVADAAGQTTKVIGEAKPIASPTIQTISSADPIVIAGTAGALFLTYLLLPPIWFAIRPEKDQDKAGIPRLPSSAKSKMIAIPVIPAGVRRYGTSSSIAAQSGRKLLPGSD
ncbi:hypothetical protein L3X38_029731 [Prunus dulcis]|uniref:Uncharacterized protein n=1 Tax=Prunus dulcis TaxID=3755 RepID=A0AAD4VSF0_PRUDU|nr:hypothetical protein L3X38_029731 [Prunus dulcis]